MTEPTILYRGTTPEIALNVTGVNLSSTYWQTVVVTLKDSSHSVEIENDGGLGLTPRGGGATGTDGCRVTFTLTQAQTLGFAPLTPVSVQLRARGRDGQAIASPIRHVIFHDILRDGEV